MESAFTVCPVPPGTDYINSISLAQPEYQHHRLDFTRPCLPESGPQNNIYTICAYRKMMMVSSSRYKLLLPLLWCSVTGWERYKKAFCQEIGISLFILGTCFHSYINVVEVRRSGIPVSDPLHELCSSPIDFHPTLGKKKRRRKKKAAPAQAV